MSGAGQEYRRHDGTRRPFQFTVRTLLCAMTALAVACGAAKTFGLQESLRLTRAGVPWAVFLLQVWQIRKPGPKRLGVVSFLAIMALKMFFWFSRASCDAPDPSLFVVFLGSGLAITIFVVWLYSSVRAVLTWTSPNCELGLLSLAWIFDANVLLFCDYLQRSLCSVWTPAAGNVRPFRAALHLIWGE